MEVLKIKNNSSTKELKDVAESLSELQESVVLLRRVREFEDHLERSRFYLGMGFGGLLAIFAGWVEIVAQHILGTDPTLILFLRDDTYTLSDYSVFWLVTWLIHVTPIVLLLGFVLRSQTLEHWSRFYFNTGLLWGLCLFLAFFLNSFLVAQDQEFISSAVISYSIFVFIAAALTPIVNLTNEKIHEIRIYFWSLGVMSLIYGIVSFLVEDTLQMGVYCGLLGGTLIIASLFGMWFERVPFKIEKLVPPEE